MFNVPKIGARFVLDGNDKPMALESKGLKHYKIEIFIDGEVSDVSTVHYKLHPTYYDPVREVSNRSGRFGLKTTTYGDYPVMATLIGGERITIRRDIYDALKESHSSQHNPDISRALEDVRTH